MKPKNEAELALHLGERGNSLSTFTSKNGKSFLFKDGSTLRPCDVNHISQISEGALGLVSLEFFEGDKNSNKNMLNPFKPDTFGEGTEHKPELFNGLRIDFTLDESDKKTLFVHPSGKGILHYTVDQWDDNAEDVMNVEQKKVENMLKELNLDTEMITEVIKNKNTIENKNENVFSRLKKKISIKF